ncbi:MAG: alpha/beta hydrolase [Hyphomicrobiaceae bacterium]|nr:alpha/beta hydrolase [Hyphomicrobiaceae bacterium]
MTTLPPLETSALPAGIRARFVDDVAGMRVHLLESGYETPGRPLLLLLHGFPELAYSWRRVMVPLAAAGYHVVAPDQRGYGRTTGWSDAYDQDLRPFAMLNLARDALALTYVLGYRQAAAVVGHDFGAAVASWCALTRPDVFRRCVIMSAPFAGPPSLPYGTAAGIPSGHGDPSRASPDLDAALADLARPRKHYQRYYTTRPANADMTRAPEGVGAFLRAYFHHKSADWSDNKPFRLKDWSADSLALMPTYYIMDRDCTMAETVRPHLPSPGDIAACRWLTEAEMAVYTCEYGRTGFQGGLNWYRARYEPHLNADLSLYSNKAIAVPSMFVAGASDWGVYQAPGAFEKMQGEAFSAMRAAHLVPGAGHWVQQEQPETVVELLLDFVRSTKP